MSRIHLFEFEDLPWFPKLIRNYMTDYLQFVANKFDIYQSSVPLIKKALLKAPENVIIDLASGGGGGWMKLSEHLVKAVPEVHICLTDLYPNIEAFKKHKDARPGLMGYSTQSVSALNVPDGLMGLRTQFLSFHHFRKNDAKQILQNAVDSGTPIAIFEAQQRSVAHFIQFFFSPISVLLLTPQIKPATFGRYFFTYLIPLVPLFTWWDGVVSVLRTYSKTELRELVSTLKDSDSFHWEIGEVKSGRFSNYYLIGTPVE